MWILTQIPASSVSLLSLCPVSSRRSSSGDASADARATRSKQPHESMQRQQLVGRSSS